MNALHPLHFTTIQNNGIVLKMKTIWRKIKSILSKHRLSVYQKNGYILLWLWYSVNAMSMSIHVLTIWPRSIANVTSGGLKALPNISK